MKPTDRQLDLDLAGARYLHALEQADFAAMASLWVQAGTDPELEAILREIHAGMIDEFSQQLAAGAEAALVDAVTTHLPSAEIAGPEVGPVTVGDVANELFRHAPDRLSGNAHQLNDRLRTENEPLPTNLGLTPLIAWGESKFGSAPLEYWQAFRQVAVKLELRRAATAEYALAARAKPKPKDAQ